MTNMYKDTRTWSPFKGCAFDCTYCRPTFQAQAKRQKHVCARCYDYTPHEHPERLGSIPAAPIVFVAGNGDLAFCSHDFMQQIITSVLRHSEKHQDVTYYLQSKRPEVFAQYLNRLPPSVVLVTTLETNRDAGYAAISKAPPPSERYRQFAALDWPRKVVTIEPVLDFDCDVFRRTIVSLKPEYVWLGYNSRPRAVQLPEPTLDKVLQLEAELKACGVPVKRKAWR